MMTRRFSASLALLAFLGANVAVALHYGHHHEHHAPVLRDAVSAAEPACACGHHAHSPAGEPGEPSPSRRSPSPDRDDHCLICQTLANKPLLTLAAVAVSEAEFVVERTVEQTPAPNSADRALPFSRGPPTV